MARPKKKTEAEIKEAEQHTKDQAPVVLHKHVVAMTDIEPKGEDDPTLKVDYEKEWHTKDEPMRAAPFLFMKGIQQPPITSAPLQGQYAISYDKLIELLNEFKNG